MSNDSEDQDRNFQAAAEYHKASLDRQAAERNYQKSKNDLMEANMVKQAAKANFVAALNSPQLPPAMSNGRQTVRLTNGRGDVVILTRIDSDDVETLQKAAESRKASLDQLAAERNYQKAKNDLMEANMVFQAAKANYQDDFLRQRPY